MIALFGVAFAATGRLRPTLDVIPNRSQKPASRRYAGPRRQPPGEYTRDVGTDGEGPCRCVRTTHGILPNHGASGTPTIPHDFVCRRPLIATVHDLPVSRHLEDAADHPEGPGVAKRPSPCRKVSSDVDRG